MIPEILQINDKEYRVLKLLGKGKGGYSYLVEEPELGDSSDVETVEEKAERTLYVLKQIHHEPCDYYQFGNKLESELNDYKRLSTIGIRMPKLLAVDVERERILKEYIEGDTIYTLVKENRMEQKYIEQMHAMCDLLYPAHTNIDYFPTNFVVQQGEIYYIDFECNDYMEEWNFENWGVKYWSKTFEFLKYMEEHQ